MIIISWNSRGLGNPRTVRDLHQMVKEKQPNLVFLMETLSQKSHLERIKQRLGFDGLFVVDLVHKSGGLHLCGKWLETWKSIFIQGGILLLS